MLRDLEVLQFAILEVRLQYEEGKRVFCRRRCVDWANVTKRLFYGNRVGRINYK